jgi:hypothetical protein
MVVGPGHKDPSAHTQDSQPNGGFALSMIAVDGALAI